MKMGKTLFEKIWDSHVVVEKGNGPSLIYIDRHLVHEVTSPQAFDGLRINNRKVRRPDLTIATMDHNVPTTDRGLTRHLLFKLKPWKKTVRILESNYST